MGFSPEVRMTIPFRGCTGHSTYFIPSSTFQKAALLQTRQMARLFIDVLMHYRGQQRYRLHEFVVMPNHFHVLITPLAPVSLEKTIQFIEGGFSYRARKELDFVERFGRAAFTLAG
jgi:REP-associated tyrosine transposase